MFKNSVGRPSKKIIMKRNICKIMSIILVAGIIVFASLILSNFNISKIKGELSNLDDNNSFRQINNQLIDNISSLNNFFLEIDNYYYVFYCDNNEKLIVKKLSHDYIEINHLEFEIRGDHFKTLFFNNKIMLNYSKAIDEYDSIDEILIIDKNLNIESNFESDGYDAFTISNDGYIIGAKEINKAIKIVKIDPANGNIIFEKTNQFNIEYNFSRDDSFNLLYTDTNGDFIILAESNMDTYQDYTFKDSDLIIFSETGDFKSKISISNNYDNFSSIFFDSNNYIVSTTNTVNSNSKLSIINKSTKKVEKTINFDNISGVFNIIKENGIINVVGLTRIEGSNFKIYPFIKRFSNNFDLIDEYYDDSVTFFGYNLFLHNNKFVIGGVNLDSIFAYSILEYEPKSSIIVKDNNNCLNIDNQDSSIGSQVNFNNLCDDKQLENIKIYTKNNIDITDSFDINYENNSIIKPSFDIVLVPSFVDKKEESTTKKTEVDVPTSTTTTITSKTYTTLNKFNPSTYDNILKYILSFGAALIIIILASILIIKNKKK